MYHTGHVVCYNLISSSSLCIKQLFLFFKNKDTEIRKQGKSETRVWICILVLALVCGPHTTFFPPLVLQRDLDDEGGGDQNLSVALDNYLTLRETDNNYFYSLPWSVMA